jgi:hypothetical protein
MSEFEVGDKIKVVTEETEKYHGRKGDLVRIKYSDPHGYIYRLEFDNQYGTVGFKANEIKKVDNMSDFKSFYVNVDGPNHSRILQEIAFEEGFAWNSDDLGLIDHLDKDELSFECGDSIFYNPHSGVTELEDPTLEEFRKALRGNYDWEEPIEIGGYEVEFNINEGGDSYIIVGCEKYHVCDLKHVYEHIQNAKDGLYPSYSIKIKHDDLGEIPFEKIEAIYNRIID